MIINKVVLEAVAVAKAGFPSSGLPELALCGRSNVGKSSFINTMTGRKALARTSQSPGKTRTINFYNVEDKLFLVDLPGYGYSKAGKDESRKWGKMVEGYLSGRGTLKAILMLLDIRRDPSADDKLMLDYVRHYGYPLIAVITKADKLSRSKATERTADIKKSLRIDDSEQVIPFSSVTKLGRDAVWDAILNQCQQTKG